VKTLLILLLSLLTLTACEGLVGAPPTLTPTVYVPPLDATVTINPAPPTELPGDFANLPFAGLNNPTAAAAPNQSGVSPDMTLAPEARPQLVTITTASEATLNGELYRPVNLALGQTTPGILIVSTRFDEWSGFPLVLRDAGFTVLSVETRIPALPGDFTAMLDTLIAETTVNPESIGVIGAESGADVAFIGCSEDARCKTAVLLTPLDRPALLGVMSAFNPRPLLVAASQNDTDAAQTAEALRLAARGEAMFQPFDDAGRGAQILVNRTDMQTLIIDWLNRHLGG
jgi:hypothetical protein